MPADKLAPSFGRKASVRNARLRALLFGASKSGKSFDALVIATTLIETLKKHDQLRGNGEILVIDSEDGRAEEQYGDVFDFYTYGLDTYEPETYMSAITQGVNAGFSCIIIDQITHAWSGKNGILDQKNKYDLQSQGNTWAGWGVFSPKHKAFIDHISRCTAHTICTARAKVDWDVETTETGKKKPVKIGFKPDQREDTDYEFDVVGQIDANHILSIETRGSLSRIIGDRQFHPGRTVDDPGDVKKLGIMIGEWIAGRANVESGLFATRDQIHEIQALGDQLGLTPANWRAIYKQAKISSLDSMDQKTYERFKKDMITRLSVKSEDKQKV